MKTIRRSFTLMAMLLAIAVGLQAKPHKPPKLAVFIVVDQLPYFQVQRLKPHLTGGLQFLLERGTNYTNVLHPHAKPSTATGHAALSTGTLAYNHGYIDNKWINPQGVKITCGDDHTPYATAFLPSGSGMSDYGISSHHLMVDTLSDQLMINSHPHKLNMVFSLSLKTRAAVAMAGKMGKAFWFDSVAGGFTTSKAYAETLPTWVSSFNAGQISPITSYSWNKAYPHNERAYSFFQTSDYEHCAKGASVIGTQLSINRADKKPYDFFTKTPLANQKLFDFAKECIRTQYTKTTSGTFVLWLSLSSPDLTGHIFGPDSLENIDILYHLDKQLNDFLEFVYDTENARDVLVALTADHGVMSIPELVRKKGYNPARRILSKPLIDEMNTIGSRDYDVVNIATFCKPPSLYLDNAQLKTMPVKKRKEMLRTFKKYLAKQPGIKEVWLNAELKDMDTQFGTFEHWYKHQLYPGRSGHLICHVHPYCSLTGYGTGTSHATPYHYDTHVPLTLYQKGVTEHKQINKRVWTPQVPVTLATMLCVPKPSAATFTKLPLA